MYIYIYIHIYITESVCCIAEMNETLNQLYFNKIKKELLMFRVCMKLLEFKFTQIL